MEETIIVKEELRLLFVRAKERFFIYDKLNKKGVLAIKRNGVIYQVDLVKLGIELTQVDEKIFKDDNFKVYVLEQRLSLERGLLDNRIRNIYSTGDKEVIKGYKIKRNKEIRFNLLYKAEIKKEPNSDIYILYNRKSKKMELYNTKNLYEDIFFIEEEVYCGLKNLMLKTEGSSAKYNIEEALKLKNSFLTTFDELHYTIWLKNIINDLNFSDKDKKEHLYYLYRHNLKQSKYLPSNFRASEKTIDFIKYYDLVDKSFFERLFKEYDSTINFTLKLLKVEEVKELDLFNKDHRFYFQEEMYEKIVDILNADFYFKDELMQEVISNGSLYNSIDKTKEGLEDKTLITYIHYLLKTLKINPKNSLYLDEVIGIIKDLDLEFVYMKDATYLKLKDELIFIDIEYDLSFLASKSDQYEKYNLDLPKNIKTNNDEILNKLAVLDFFKIINLKDKKENQLIKEVVKHNLKYEDYNELILTYINSGETIKESIEETKDFEYIKEDLKFFN